MIAETQSEFHNVIELIIIYYMHLKSQLHKLSFPYQNIIKKGYCSLDVRLDPQFEMIAELKENFDVATICSVFDVNRSSFRSWYDRDKQACPEQVKAEVMVKAIFTESGGSAGARTVATIATRREVSLSRYRAGKLMKKLI